MKEGIKVVNDFVWLIVTDKASSVYDSGLFELYTLHEDGSESSIESWKDLQNSLDARLDIAIEVGHIVPYIEMPRQTN